MALLERLCQSIRTDWRLGRSFNRSRSMPRARKPTSPFRHFNSSPEVMRLVVMMYVRLPLSLRNVEDLLFVSVDRTFGGTRGVD